MIMIIMMIIIIITIIITIIIIIIIIPAGRWEVRKASYCSNSVGENRMN